ncbi:MAG: hypothetical protein WC483_03340 [Candidatus Paceibacterota bacterium]
MQSISISSVRPIYHFAAATASSASSPHLVSSSKKMTRQGAERRETRHHPLPHFGFSTTLWHFGQRKV